MCDFVASQSNGTYLISRDEHRFYLSEQMATPYTPAKESLLWHSFLDPIGLLTLKGNYIIIIIIIFVCRSKVVDHKEISSSILTMGSTMPFISYLITSCIINNHVNNVWVSYISHLAWCTTSFGTSTSICTQHTI